MTDNENKPNKLAVDNLRAASMPGFVTLDWFKSQFGVYSTKQRLAQTKKFSNMFQHWRGDEDEKEFYEKALADLSVPGFAKIYMGIERKKPPFIIQRLYAAGLRQVAKTESPLQAVLVILRQKEKMNDLAELAFFTAIYEIETDAQALSIDNCEVSEKLLPFLNSMAEKKTRAQSASYVHTMAQLSEHWQTALKNIHSELDEMDIDIPDEKTLEKFEANINILRRIANDYDKTSAHQRDSDYQKKREEAFTALSTFCNNEPSGNQHSDQSKASSTDTATSTLLDKIGELPKSLPASEHWHVFKDDSFSVALANVLTALKEGEALRRQIADATDSEELQRTKELSQQESTLREKCDMLSQKALELLHDAKAPATEVAQSAQITPQWQPPTASARDAVEQFENEWDKTTKSVIAYIDSAGDEPNTTVTNELKKGHAHLREVLAGYEQAVERQTHEELLRKLANVEQRLRKQVPAKSNDDGETSEALNALFVLLQKLGEPTKAHRTKINWQQLDETIDVLCDMLKNMGALHAKIKTLSQSGDHDAMNAATSEVDKIKPRHDVLVQRAMDALHGKWLSRLPDFDKIATANAAPAEAAQSSDAVEISEEMAAEQAAENEIQRELDKDERRKSAYRRLVNKTVAGYLQLGEFEVAAMLARCGEQTKHNDNTLLEFPANVLEWLAAPEQMLVADVESVNAHISDNGKTALFAAALPAVLFVPGIRQLYKTPGIFSGICAEDTRLEAIRRAVENLGTRVLTASEFLQAAPNDDANDDVEVSIDADDSATPQQLLQAWYDDKKHKTMKYAPATYLWQNWMKESGALGSAIVPLLSRHNTKAAAKLLEQCHSNHSTESFINADVKGIEASVRQHLITMFEEGIDHLRAVINDDMQTDAGDSTALCKKLHHALANFQPRSSDNFNTNAAERCLAHGISLMQAPLLEQIETNSVPTHTRVGMAKVPDIWHDGDGKLLDNDMRLIRRAFRSLQNFPDTVEQQFKKRIAEGAPLSALLLLPLITDDAMRDALQTICDSRIQTLRASLTSNISTMRKKINAAAPSVNTEAANELLSQLEAIKSTDLPSKDGYIGGKLLIHDFPQTHKLLEKVELLLMPNAGENHNEDDESNGGVTNSASIAAHV